MVTSQKVVRVKFYGSKSNEVIINEIDFTFSCAKTISFILHHTQNYSHLFLEIEWK